MVARPLLHAALLCSWPALALGWQPAVLRKAVQPPAMPMLLQMMQPQPDDAMLPSDAMITPTDEAPLSPEALPEQGLPAFSWRTVLFFAFNPIALLPVPLLLFLTLRIQLLGSAFTCNAMAIRLSALFSALLLGVTSLPLEKLPGLASFGEVTRASKTICLYAFGASFRPMRAAAAALVLSASAALCEELAFRGALMGAIDHLLGAFLPSGWALGLALTLQALVFGAMHSYTASRAYFVAASLAGLAFGGAFAATRNLAVPIIMHFVVDLASFNICHWQLARAPASEQWSLILADSPIARVLRKGSEPPAPAAAPPAPGLSA